MSFYSKDVVASPLHKYLAGNTPVGDLLDVLQEEPRGLAIDTVSGKILVRDRDDYTKDKFVDINPADPADSVLNFSGSQKFIMRSDGSMGLTAVGEIPIQHKYNSVTDTYEPAGILIEQQSTNLLINSRGSYDDWPSKSKMLSAAAFDFGPFTSDAIRLPQNVTGSSAYAVKNVTVVDGETYCMSFYVHTDDGAPPDFTQPSRYSTNSFGIESLNMGLRDLMQDQAIVERVSSNCFRVHIIATAIGTSINVGIIKTAQNDTSQEIHISKWNLELSTHTTSYIETNASTVTRTADVSTILVADFPWNETQGTFFVEYAKSETDFSGILGPFMPSPYLNRDFFYTNTTPHQYAAYDFNNSVNPLNIIAVSGFQKFAFTFDSVGSTLAHGGVSNTNLAANNWAGTELLRLGTRFGVTNGTCLIKSIVYKPYRITEQQAEDQT